MNRLWVLTFGFFFAFTLPILAQSTSAGAEEASGDVKPTKGKHVKMKTDKQKKLLAFCSKAENSQNSKCRDLES